MFAGLGWGSRICGYPRKLGAWCGKEVDWEMSCLLLMKVHVRPQQQLLGFQRWFGFHIGCVTSKCLSHVFHIDNLCRTRPWLFSDPKITKAISAISSGRQGELELLDLRLSPIFFVHSLVEQLRASKNSRSPFGKIHARGGVWEGGGVYSGVVLGTTSQ